jgi:hypothetical protein
MQKDTGKELFFRFDIFKTYLKQNLLPNIISAMQAFSSDKAPLPLLISITF